MNINEGNSLKFKKGNVTKDLVTDFKMVCMETPMAIKAEIKELTATEFYGEDGESVYFPDQLTVKPFDWKVKMGTLGETPTECLNNIKAFINYMCGRDNLGTAVDIYASWTGVGRKNCYMKEFGDVEMSRDNELSICEFEVTFRITDPTTLITL